MNQHVLAVVRLVGLVTGAALMIGGHELIARYLMTALRDLPASPGFASVAASMAMTGVGGVFVLPMLHHLCGPSRGAVAACVAVGAALGSVWVRALVEAAAGVWITGLPLLGMAVAAGLVGGLTLVGAPAAVRSVRVVKSPPPRIAFVRRLRRVS